MLQARETPTTNQILSPHYQTTYTYIVTWSEAQCHGADKCLFNEQTIFTHTQKLSSIIAGQVLLSCGRTQHGDLIVLSYWRPSRWHQGSIANLDILSSNCANQALLLCRTLCNVAPSINFVSHWFDLAGIRTPDLSTESQRSWRFDRWTRLINVINGVFIIILTCHDGYQNQSITTL